MTPEAKRSTTPSTERSAKRSMKRSTKRSPSAALRPARARARAVLGATQLAAALVALTIPVAAAQAQVIRGERDRFKSPQRFALELRFGPYRPDIDGEFDGASSPHTPYQDFFGSKRRLMSQIELDYQVFRHFGSAGLGLGLGYFTAEGNNRLDGGQISDDTSTLTLVPISLSAVYRFDWLLERFKIPLVPYGKVGLDYSIWYIRNGNGDIPQDPTGGTARGGTWGWHAAAGLSLVLDFFEPDAARKLDIESGINHTHLFLELGHWDVSGLGSSNKLHVGDSTWMAGLMFEF